MTNILVKNRFYFNKTLYFIQNVNQFGKNLRKIWVFDIPIIDFLYIL